MKKIIFQYGKIKVRVRDVVIAAAVLLLLFLVPKACSKEQTKEDKIKEIVKANCVFPFQNIKDLNELLRRADLCSEKWFEDFDLYITRLKDQNKALGKFSEAKNKKLYKTQKRLIGTLEAFRANQTDTTIREMEEMLKEYQALSEKGCNS